MDQHSTEKCTQYIFSKTQTKMHPVQQTLYPPLNKMPMIVERIYWPRPLLWTDKWLHKTNLCLGLISTPLQISLKSWFEKWNKLASLKNWQTLELIFRFSFWICTTSFGLIFVTRLQNNGVCTKFSKGFNFLGHFIEQLYLNNFFLLKPSTLSSS